jgi:hypothetical protein
MRHTPDDAILAKVRKLLAKAEDDACTPAQAEALPGPPALREVCVASGANVGNWYPLGGEFGRPKVWIDPCTELEKLVHRPRDPQPRSGPGEVPLHPEWADVVARGPVTLLVPAPGDAFAAGWAERRRRLLEQAEELRDDEDVPPPGYGWRATAEED